MASISGKGTDVPALSSTTAPFTDPTVRKSVCESHSISATCASHNDGSNVCVVGITHLLHAVSQEKLPVPLCVALAFKRHDPIHHLLHANERAAICARSLEHLQGGLRALIYTTHQ